MEEPPNLDTIHDDALDAIMKFVDVKGIMTLRKVCHHLRNYMIRKVPDIKLKQLEIRYGIDSASIGSNGLLLSYQQNDANCQLIISGHRMRKRKILKNSNFRNLFVNDAKLFIKHQKSVLDCFWFRRNPVDPQPFEEIQEMLKERETNHLKVKTLFLHIQNQDNIMAVLPYLDPDEINTIQLTSDGDNIHLEMEKVIELDQWKKAEELRLYGCWTSIPIEHLIHFEDCSVHLDTISLEQFKVLKEKFLEPTSRKKRLNIQYQKHTEMQQILDYLGPRSILHVPPKWKNEKQWYFRKHGTDDAIHIVLDENFSEISGELQAKIKFYRTDLCCIHENFTVYD